ncbi:TonB-dependent receptor [Mucilaginibacter sp.]|uniref:SusC/RagA family TonB-linked outer membrane protein n=1 Tax=Mucilaginibacter sp. TaxID=1882438 RepID=UPI00261DFC7E|nr:TonB-dependent receptor [Mucilaginibacter sp.]
MLTSIAFAQTAIISGTVIDENNQPLPGASVVVKGSQNGIATDVNGNYKLSVTNGSVTIVASFIGYQPIERTLTVTGNVTSDFKLAPDAKSLGEVVVIGYGTAKKSDLTGAIATVTAKDFNQGAVTTPEQLIQGKVAGVSIISNSGAPGSGSTIRIRGGASVNGSNNPLIVIDGVPLDNPRNTDGTSRISGVADPLSLINPNDIESFNILKDASAAAIYGNRASNGVILITTKKGRAGKPVINFSTQFSVATLPKEAPVLSPDQFRTYVRANDTTSSKKYISLLGSANTDWQKQIYQTSYSTDNNLSLSGTTAKDKLPYRVSVGYTDQNGILKTSSLERYTGAINLSPSLFTDHLKINFNFKGAQVKQRFAKETAIGNAVSFNPTLPVYSGNNNYGGYTQILDATNTPSGLKSLAPLNPLGLLEQDNNRSTVYRAIISLAIDYKLHFFPDLHANVNVSYDASKGSGSDVIPADAASNIDVLQNGKYYNGNYSQYNQTNGNKLFEGFLSYSKDIHAIKSHVDVVAGYSFQDIKATTYNFLSYFSDGTVKASSAFNYPYSIQESQLTSGYARLNYVYDEKYLLTGTIRSDVSTRFAPGIRTGNFPSVAFAWRINREDFLKDNQTLSNLKLRLEYGVTGNQDGIGNYDYLSPYSLSNTTAQYQFGSNYYQMYRPAAYYYGRTWEQTSTANVAFDYGFLNDRITGSLDYYYRKTKNLLATIGQPAGSNFGNQITGNVGNMVDQGLEFSINARIIDTKDISWSANLNATYDKNKITNLTLVTTPDFPGLQVGGISGGTGQTIQIDQVGYPKNSFYVYQQVYAANGQPLDAVFVDKNKDGLLNNKDLYINHSPDPKEYFGFSSDFRYKLWSIGFVTRASLGNYVYNNVASNTGIQRNITNPLGFINNGSSDVLKSGLTGNGSNDLLSDYYIQNASFFRMDNAHIGYNFGKIFKNTGDLRISANVQNVFVITQYKGVDPELSNGIDNNLYPRPRTYVLGVNLSL